MAEPLEIEARDSLIRRGAWGSSPKMHQTLDQGGGDPAEQAATAEEGV